MPLANLQALASLGDVSESDPYARLRSLVVGDLTQVELSRRTGIDQTVISRAFAHGKGLERHWAAIAKALGVSLDWLVLGRLHVADSPRSQGGDIVPDENSTVVREGGVAPKRDHAGVDAAREEETRGDRLALVGAVGAGPAMATVYETPRKFAMQGSLALMRVHGDSAYPVAFDGQFVYVDLKRRIHDNNLVVLRLKDGRSLLKRYCADPRAPDGFVLASINAGVSSPYVPRADIANMWAVVGVLFEEEPKDGYPEDDEPRW